MLKVSLTVGLEVGQSDRHHAKPHTIHSKLSRADPANRIEWRKKLRTNIGAVQPTLSGTDTLNE